MVALLVASRIHYLKVPSSNPVGSKKFFVSFLLHFYIEMLFFYLEYSMHVYFIMLGKKMNTFATKTGKNILWPRFNKKKSVCNGRKGWASGQALEDIWSLKGQKYENLHEAAAGGSHPSFFFRYWKWVKGTRQ